MHLRTTASFGVIGVFGVLLAGLVLTHGLCCYDDAAHAIVAKSLAQGGGYTYTLYSAANGEFEKRTFDPRMGTGPTSILPVALAIRLAGPGPTVPGFTQVAVQLTLLAAIGLTLLRSRNCERVAAFLALTLGLIVSVSGFHFEHWYALLGETVATLLVVAGCAVWTLSERRVRAAAVTGLLLGLAVLAKQQAGLFVASFLAFALVTRLRRLPERPLQAEDARALAALAAFGAGPFLLFETWRFAALGLPGFTENWREHNAFMQANSHWPASIGALIDTAAARRGTVDERFFTGLPLAFAIGAFSLYIVRRSAPRPLLDLAHLLAWSAIVNTAYWLALSNGWPRYLYPTVIVWCFVAALPLLTGISWRDVGVYLLVLALVPLSGLPRFRDMYASSLRQAFDAPLAWPNAAERAVLAHLDGQTETPVSYTLWWAHVASLEFLSSKPDRFETGAWTRLQSNTEPLQVIVNTKVIEWGPAPTVRDLVARCGHAVLDVAPYQVFRCPPATRAP